MKQGLQQYYCQWIGCFRGVLPIWMVAAISFGIASANAETDLSHVSINLSVNMKEQHLSAQVTYRFTHPKNDDQPMVFMGRSLDYQRVEKFGDRGWEEAVFVEKTESDYLGEKLYIAIEPDYKALRFTYAVNEHDLNLWLREAHFDARRQNWQEGPLLFVSTPGIDGVSTWLPLLEGFSKPLSFEISLTGTDQHHVSISHDWPTYAPPTLKEGQFHYAQAQPVALDKLIISAAMVHQTTNEAGFVLRYPQKHTAEAMAPLNRQLSKMIRYVDGLTGQAIEVGLTFDVLPENYPGDIRLGQGTIFFPAFYRDNAGQDPAWVDLIVGTRLGQILKPVDARGQILLNALAANFRYHYLKRQTDDEAPIRDDYSRLLAEDLWDGLAPEETSLVPDPSVAEVQTVMSAAQKNFLILKAKLFLDEIHNRFGSDSFHLFLNSWLADRKQQQGVFQWQDFIAYFKANLWDLNPEKMPESLLDEWLYDWGLPTVPVKSPDPMAQAVAKFLDERSSPEQFLDASWQEMDERYFWLQLPETLDDVHMMALHRHFLGQKTNLSILFLRDWLVFAVNRGFAEAQEDVAAFLTEQRSILLLEPLFIALANQEEGRLFLKEFYEENRGLYHPSIQNSLDLIVGVEN